jgi:aminoglycoside N3'-acetyltransferase
VGRVYELAGQVLLLGAGHDSNTTIHLAEYLAGVRYRRKCYSIILQAGQPVRVEYGEIDHCCQNFNLVDGWLEAKGLQRRGQVGYAEARLVWSQDVVKVVVEQLKTNETTFLHPPGVDAECDEAWQSLEASDHNQVE